MGAQGRSVQSGAPTLHLVCGKAASGKSTLAAQLAEQHGAILIAEDHWLAALYAGELTSLQDYRRCAAKLRAAMQPHIVGLLRAGMSVVLDFAVNTIETRRWMRAIADEAGADDRLHVLDVPDDLCLARLRARNARGDHPFTLGDAQFEQLARYFVTPTKDEGFTIQRHQAPGV